MNVSIVSVRPLKSLVAIALPFLVFTATSAEGQLLPAGIGAYTFGGRQFTGNPSSFDDTGKSRDLGSQFNQDFTSEKMSSGKDGADLQKLYRGLQQYDAQSANATAAGEPPPEGFADQLNLGKLRGTVKANIQAKYVAMAYGVTSKWTVFGGVPFVNASVDTSLAYSGKNNALDVQQKLGDFAFDELQAGLTTASNLNATTVKNKIEQDYHYASIDHWQYKGMGDTFLGARTEYNLPRGALTRNSIMSVFQLDVPTGHSDDPDILTDAPIGKGYYSLAASAAPKCVMSSSFIGAEVGLSYGFAQKTKRRVPIADESLVAADRKTTVNWQPGQDLKFAGSIGTEGKSLGALYKIGGLQHTRDRYTGSLKGNYYALENPTVSQVRYHEATLQYSTVKTFAAKKFPIPLILALTAHDTLAGRNASNVRYYELSIMSFFKTPAAKPAK